MQLFIKMPSPYNSTFVFPFELNTTLQDLKNIIDERTVYKNCKYYILFGTTGIINEQYVNLTIGEFNKLYPSKKITNEMNLKLFLRINQ